MKITIETTIQSSLPKVWEYWTTPPHIINWNFATEEWHCPSATNDLREGGKFSWRMEAKDGSMGFDYSGLYEEIGEQEYISCKLDDGRSVKIKFLDDNDRVKVIEEFEVEESNDTELQRAGWQSILNNFKKYVEAN